MFIKKLFQAQSVSKASIVLIFSSILSYLAGLLRDRILSYYFGTSDYSDAYNTSFLIPDFLFNLFVAGAITAVFIPVFSDYLQKDKEEAYKIANTFISMAFIVVFVVSVIAFIFTPQIVNFIFSSESADQQKLIINLTRILLITPIFFALSNTLGSILISYKHFTSYAYSAVFYNIGIIAGILLFHQKFGIYSAAIGAGMGVFLHFLFRFLNIFAIDFRYKPEIDLKSPGFIKILKLMIPKTINLVSTQISLWAYNIIGYTLAAGSIAAFNFARNLQSLPVSLFGIALSTSVFPFLSDSASSGNQEDYLYNFKKTLQRILFFAIPSAVGMYYLSTPLIKIVLAGGEFDEQSISLTSSVLTVFAFSIPLESLIHLFARGFYAHKNTLTPVYFAIIAMVVNIFIAYFASKIIGVSAFSLAFVTSCAVQLLLLAIFLRKKLKGFPVMDFLKSFLKQIFSSAVMLFFIYLIPKVISFNETVIFIIQVTGGALVYFFLAYLLKCEEIKEIKTVFVKAKNV